MNLETFLTTREAADRAAVTVETIHNWIARYRIGRRVGGRYRVDPKLLSILLGDEVANDR